MSCLVNTRNSFEAYWLICRQNPFRDSISGKCSYGSSNHHLMLTIIVWNPVFHFLLLFKKRWWDSWVSGASDLPELCQSGIWSRNAMETAEVGLVDGLPLVMEEEDVWGVQFWGFIFWLVVFGLGCEKKLLFLQFNIWQSRFLFCIAIRINTNINK